MYYSRSPPTIQVIAINFEFAAKNQQHYINNNCIEEPIGTSAFQQVFFIDKYIRCQIAKLCPLTMEKPKSHFYENAHYTVWIICVLCTIRFLNFFKDLAQHGPKENKSLMLSFCLFYDNFWYLSFLPQNYNIVVVVLQTAGRSIGKNLISNVLSHCAVD